MLYFVEWAHEIPQTDFSISHMVRCILTYSVVNWSYGVVFNKISFSYYDNVTKAEHSLNSEHYFVLITFGVNFMIYNCGLLYVTFYLRDLFLLKYLLASNVVVSALLDYILYEVLLDFILGDSMKKRFSESSQCEGVNLLPLTTSSSDEMIWKRLVFDELNRSKFCYHMHHLRFITRYGFCCIFVVAFPIAPLLIWVFNEHDIKVYLKNLQKSIRVPVADSSSLMEWLSCLKFINFIAVVVNCFVLCILTSDLGVLVPLEYVTYLDSETNRYHVIVGCHCHLLICCELIC